jgi:1,4-dihydroxy-6-naphthoate synthase
MPVLTLAHSPDADDMVMFWPLTGMVRSDGSRHDGALGAPAIDTGGFTFRVEARDVEELNRVAITSVGDGERAYDVSAISAATYPLVAGAYAITACGGSFGEGYGPKVVVREDDARVRVDELSRARVAVPGTRTTAFLTMSLMLGAGAFEPVEMLFSEIPDAVSRGAVDAGLLIHEAQLMLDRHGLRELADVGAWWHEHTGLTLPLGLNVVRRDLDERFGAGTVERVSAMLQASVRHAREHAKESRTFLLEHAGDREEWKDEGLVEMYLSMYVSEMTVDMGRTGRTALRRLFDEAGSAGLCPPVGEIDVI